MTPQSIIESIAPFFVDLAFLPDALLKITIVLMATWALVKILKPRNPRWRTLLWRLGALGILATPLAILMGPGLELAVDWNSPRPAESLDEERIRSTDSVGVLGTSPVIVREFRTPPQIDPTFHHRTLGESGFVGSMKPTKSSPPQATIASSKDSVSLWTIAGMVWGLGVVLLFARFAVGLNRVRRIVRATEPAPDTITEMCREIAADIGIQSSVTVRVSATVSSPQLTGLFHPTIVMPSGICVREDQSDIPAILAHELAHHKSRDLHWGILIQGISYSLWPHPLVWRMSESHSTACEEVSDAVSAEYVGGAEAYSRTLARLLMGMVSKDPTLGTVPMARGANITHRLKALKQGLFHLPLKRRWWVTSSVSACVLLGLVGATHIVQAEESEKAGTENLKERTVTFPEDHAVARIYLREADLPMEKDWGDDWEEGEMARGEVTIPEGKLLGLKFPEHRKVDLSFLEDLEADTIHGLHLENGILEDVDLEKLASQKSIRFLNLSRTPITGDGLKHVAKLPNLKWLRINRLEIGEEGLSHLTSLDSLVYLDAYKTPIGDDGLEVLAKIPSFRCLEVERTGITDQGLFHLKSLPNLERISLEDNAITDEGLKTLGENDSLRFLNLRRTKITDEGLAHLSSLDHLRFLMVPMQISSQGLGTLKDLPTFVMPGARKRIVFKAIDEGSERPVPGVTLSVRNATSCNEQHTEEFITDENGIIQFAYPLDSKIFLSLTAEKEGFVPKKINWNVGEDLEEIPDEYVMKMEEGTVIGGVIQDEEGDPVEGVEVHLLVPSEDVSNQDGTEERVAIWDYVVKTDGVGKWMADIMPKELEDVWIRLTHEDYISDKTYGATPKPSIEELRDQTGVMVLKKGMTLEGVVLDEAGAPIEGANVAQGSDRWGSHYPKVSTDLEGKFAFANAEPGEIVLTVQAEGFAPDLKTVHFGKGSKPAEFRLEEGDTIRGRVVDTEGDPVEGAFVAADTWRGHRSIEFRVETDAEGRFQWNEAPEDEVLFDMGARGYMSERNHGLSPSEEEYVITLNPVLTVKGKVVDAETGEPVETFRILRGIDWGNNNPLHFSAHDKDEGENGKFEIQFSEPRNAHLVRIETEGYLPNTSRKFSDDEGLVELEFKMEKGTGPEGTVLSPEGDPMEEVDVFLATPSKYLNFNNGRVSQSRNTVRAKTNQAGEFEFTPQTDPYAVVVVHDRGFAQVDRESFEATPTIQLRPWSRIEGTIRVGSEPGAGEQAYVSINQPYDPKMPRVHFGYSTTTDQEGHFEFDRVIPGSVSVGRQIKMGSHSTTYSHGVPLKVEPGESYQVQVGGTGRPIQGQIVVRDTTKEIEFGFGHTSLSLLVPDPFDKEKVAAMSMEERQAFYEKWRDSEEGKAYQMAQRRYAVKIEPDGSFHVDDIPSGSYQLTVNVAEPPVGQTFGYGESIGTVNEKFRIPEMEGGRSDDPFDLGDLKLVLLKRLEVGQRVPEFTIETLGDEKISLEDYRGKYVLLDFWATWCGPCIAETPNLKVAYDRFKDHENFELIALSLDQNKEAPKKYVEKNEIEWVQGFLGNWNGTELPAEYGVRGIPSFFLVGPDGKLVAKGLRGAEVAAAIDEALNKSGPE